MESKDLRPSEVASPVDVEMTDSPVEKPFEAPEQPVEAQVPDQIASSPYKDIDDEPVPESDDDSDS